MLRSVDAKTEMVSRCPMLLGWANGGKRRVEAGSEERGSFSVEGHIRYYR